MIYSGLYRVTSPYGERVIGGRSEFHRGIDVVGITSKNVCAIDGGYVAVSQIVTDKNNKTSEWGNYVCVIGDDGRQYYYCHLENRFVKVGDRIKLGDHVGLEGNTGYSLGAHCHLEVRDSSGNTLDPSKILGIPNAAGVYGEDYREKCRRKFDLSENTLVYLDGYEYAADLYRKLAREIAENKNE